MDKKLSDPSKIKVHKFEPPCESIGWERKEIDILNHLNYLDALANKDKTEEINIFQDSYSQQSL